MARGRGRVASGVGRRPKHACQLIASAANVCQARCVIAPRVAAACAAWFCTLAANGQPLGSLASPIPLPCIVRRLQLACEREIRLEIVFRVAWCIETMNGVRLSQQWRCALGPARGARRMPAVACKPAGTYKNAAFSSFQAATSNMPRAGSAMAPRAFSNTAPAPPQLGAIRGIRDWEQFIEVVQAGTHGAQSKFAVVRKLSEVRHPLVPPRCLHDCSGSGLRGMPTRNCLRRGL